MQYVKMLSYHIKLKLMKQFVKRKIKNLTLLCFSKTFFFLLSKAIVQDANFVWSQFLTIEKVKNCRAVGSLLEEARTRIVGEVLGSKLIFTPLSMDCWKSMCECITSFLVNWNIVRKLTEEIDVHVHIHFNK